MSYSVEKIRDPAQCEELIAAVNALIDAQYTAANAIAHRSYVFEYAIAAEAFAFALHCPGSDETRHLPGFEADELPPKLAELSLEICERLEIRKGRVMLNVSRYPENCEPIMPHYDGELFDFTVIPDVGNEVRSGLRPHRVALLTLRNDSLACETRLHDAANDIIQPPARTGDLLCFDNTLYQHSVPNSGFPAEPPPPNAPRRWLRYTIGWRALEYDCFDWHDGKPLVPIRFDQAIERHEHFLKDQWPSLIDADLERATFPFSTEYR